ncbi:hypothetical protein BDU57DRAFT_317560 [Ampelomyces quisqualis]|uniref:Elongator complex protein 6 n=1 Tax=Ampelomyces quisqualis TaxID=50730 RepID=A0A6A5QHU9_AMPQU|nr:hypothetical protein BDU57DRAFT_317560 [Ampelomyces quisqualis]
MPACTRIPSHLQPYVRLPRDDSILLLTSTLGASANWLIVRFLCDALSNHDEGGEPGHNVVLGSWMREYEFWKQEARKGGGLDLERLKKEGRFAFVDGLSGLCLDADTSTGAHAQSRRAGAPLKRNGLIEGPQSKRGALIELPPRAAPGQILPARGPPPAAAPRTATTPKASTSPGHFALTSLDLAHLKATVTDAVSSLSSSPSTSHRKTLLVLDNPDLLLALDPSLTHSALTSLMLTLRALPTVSHILTHIQADTPLLSLSTPPQLLELAHHNFLVKLGHMSRRILGVRVLDTGVARDVSGVVRVTQQELGWTDFAVSEGAGKESAQGTEYLYQVRGDGSVRVFERGAGGDG